MPPWGDAIITVFVTALASTGFWTFIQSRSSKNNAEKELLVGLAHDRIIHVGKQYIRRGYITYDEYNDFITYLYNPYEKLGGNGLALKVKQAVDNLPMSSEKLDLSKRDKDE